MRTTPARNVGRLAIAATACATILWGCEEFPGTEEENSASPPVRLEGLLEEMTDLSTLARFPDPAYQHRLASSTDPSASDPSDARTWFVNEDLDHYAAVEEREGRTEYVMLETSGPGAILRIWSANPAGTLRIYIDDLETPAIEADMKALLSGRVPPFEPPFAYTAARGANLYFPFPYRSAAKVTMDTRGAFYQVNYRSYPEGTEVQPFRPEELAQQKARLERIAATLENPSTLPTDTAAMRSTHFTKTARIEGPAALRELRIEADGADAQQLRSQVLVIRADDKETVRVPLGDFFGSGPGRTPYQTLAAEVTKDGTFIARWPMPFRDSLEVTVEGTSGPGLRGRILSEPWTWDERSLYFHATWREEPPGPTWPPRDWNLVSIRGRGAYVGTLLEITNSTKAWWGEGDEKIRVDDEDFPSHFGTGTEDYFGYAWSTPVPFQRPYHSQTIAEGPGGYGAFSMHRWHILDPIPFTRSLAFDQEIWHWSRTATIALGAVSYFYADFEATTNGFRVRPGEAGLHRPPELPRKTLEGALEGESFAAHASSGAVRTESMVRYLGGLWSNDEQLRWQSPPGGETLELSFRPERAGRYRVLANLTRGQPYGRFKLSVNDGSSTKAVDLGFPIVGNLDRVDLGIHDLSAEQNILRIRSVGASARGGGADFGLDCLLLEPAP